MTEDNLKDLLAEYDDDNDPRLNGYPATVIAALRYVKEKKGISIKKQLDEIDKKKIRERKTFNDFLFSNEDQTTFKSKGGKHSKD
jgi:hypothetical protein